MTDKSNYLQLVQMSEDWYDDFNIVHRWFYHILPPKSENQTGKPIRIFQYMANKDQLAVSVEYLIYLLRHVMWFSILFYPILVSNYNYFFFRLFSTNLFYIHLAMEATRSSVAGFTGKKSNGSVVC